MAHSLVGKIRQGHQPPDQAPQVLISDYRGAVANRVTLSSGDIKKSPEPSTLLLAGLGVSFVGFSTWRKRRRQVKADNVA
jgi:hypothetical protein